MMFKQAVKSTDENLRRLLNALLRERKAQSKRGAK